MCYTKRVNVDILDFVSSIPGGEKVFYLKSSFFLLRLDYRNY